MFVLGIFSFFQCVFVPGFLLLGFSARFSVLRGPGTGVSRVVYGFGLSLLFNYLLVFLLTAKRLYYPVSFYFVILLEIGVLVYLWRKRGSEGLSVGFEFGGVVDRVRRFFVGRSLMFNVLFLVGLGVLFIYVFFFFYFLGTVFEHWDPVTGWNRFAVDWAANRFPLDTWRYPQLVPANWSVSYVLMGTTVVQSFARAVMPLFAIGNLLLFLDLGVRKNSSVYLVGLVFYGGLLMYFYSPSYVASGYMDIPVSFFGFLSFHALHSRDDADGAWWAVIFGCAAGVTKQAGLFILVIILVWSVSRWVNVSKKPGALGMPVRRRVLVMLVMVLVITASWYILKEVQISRGLDKSEVGMVQQAHRMDTMGERVDHALDLLLGSKSAKLKPVMGLFFLLVLLGIFHRESRRVALFVMIPFTLLWLFFFSYDTRNLALAVPFMAFSAAFGTVVFKRLAMKVAGAKRPKIGVVPLLVIVVLGLGVLNFTVFKKENLLAHQEAKTRKVGDAGLNKLLYDYHETHGLTGKVVTNYQYLRFLPGLKGFYYYRPGRLGVKFLDFLETGEGKEIHYMLEPIVQKREKEVYRRFWDNIKSKKYRMIFKYKGYHFVKVR